MHYFESLLHHRVFFVLRFCVGIFVFAVGWLRLCVVFLSSYLSTVLDCVFFLAFLEFVLEDFVAHLSLALVYLFSIAALFDVPLFC